MKNNGSNRSPLLGGSLKALGLLGVVGMAGAIVLIGPLAGSGCNEGSGGNGGHAGNGGAIGSLGGSGGHVDAGTDSVISATASQVLIQNIAFMPDTLTVAPGATVNVHNVDSVQHTMTSESTAGAITPGGVAGVSFDTGLIAPGGSASFTIPANAPHGTVVPFYCQVHGAAMQGTLTVQ
jgi:plastocyanin